MTRAAEQSRQMLSYLRTLRANHARAYRELSEVLRVRKGRRLELALRYRRFEQASELLRLAEQCLEEIRHCYALHISAFRPGDHVLVKTTVRGFAPDPRRYLILDVEWRKRDQYSYVVQELTKAGLAHKGRHVTWLWPSGNVSIEICDEPLPDETKARAEGRRQAMKRYAESVLEKGDLTMFLPKTPPSTPTESRYPFWARNYG